MMHPRVVVPGEGRGSCLLLEAARDKDFAPLEAQARDLSTFIKFDVEVFCMLALWASTQAHTVTWPRPRRGVRPRKFAIREPSIRAVHVSVAGACERVGGPEDAVKTPSAPQDARVRRSTITITTITITTMITIITITTYCYYNEQLLVLALAFSSLSGGCGCSPPCAKFAEQTNSIRRRAGRKDAQRRASAPEYYYYYYCYYY